MNAPAGRRPHPAWLVLASIASVQVGASFAKRLFGQVPPTSMTWLRLIWAALLLVALNAWLRRRRQHPVSAAGPRTLTGGRGAPGPLLAYAACLVAMNWAIYQSFSRIPIGMAVTIEFLGPLAVSVASSRRARDLVWVVLAAGGVAMMGLSPHRPSLAGVALALLAGCAWGGYILAGARVTRSWAPLDAVTLACAAGAVALAFPGIVRGGPMLWRPGIQLIGLAVGLLSSVIPYLLELVALRSLPPRVFGVLMSLEPVMAALAALVVLGERLSPVDLLAMACIIVASVGSTRDA